MALELQIINGEAVWVDPDTFETIRTEGTQKMHQRGHI
jgi:hypothetical protein